MAKVPRTRKKTTLFEEYDSTPCASGSIEQQLDRCEEGLLRGDEHSFGLQGGESELLAQPRSAGMPGDGNREQTKQVDDRERKLASDMPTETPSPSDERV